MKYKVGDKVRVRGDLGVGKVYDGITFRKEMGEKCVFEVVGVDEEKNCIVAKNKYCLTFSSEMLRPAEFKIWCETEEEKQAVLEELEKEGYVWINSGEKPTEWKGVYDAPMYFSVSNGKFSQFSQFFKSVNRKWIEKDKPELTPSEFTGINLSEKIIITKTPTGATATYGDKTVTAEGEFKEASRQALAEVLCPFKVGEWVQHKYNWNIRGMVAEISSDMEVRVCSGVVDTWLEFEEIEPCKEPLFSGRAVCVEDSVEFTKGKIYKFTDGTVRDNGGCIEPIPPKKIRNEKDLQEYGFLAIVEGE